MNRLLSAFARKPVVLFGASESERGIWFEFGELLQAWARWLLGG